MAGLRRTATEIPGLWLLTGDLYRDARGHFREVYRRDHYTAAGLGAEFVQDNLSHSVRGVLRGLHYQTRRPQAKLVAVLRGVIFDAVVDLRRGSPAFGRYVAVELTDAAHRLLYVPAGCAHGFCVVSPEADVLYKCTDFYDPGGEGGLLWSDPALAIPWPIADPLLSAKDRVHPCLADIPPDTLPAWKPTADAAP